MTLGGVQFGGVVVKCYVRGGITRPDLASVDFTDSATDTLCFAVTIIFRCESNGVAQL
jgi:hypothetical protein